MVPRLFVSISRCGSLVLYTLAKNDVAKKPASGRTDIVMDKWPTSSAHYIEGNKDDIPQGFPTYLGTQIIAYTLLFCQFCDQITILVCFYPDINFHKLRRGRHNEIRIVIFSFCGVLFELGYIYIGI